MTPLQQRTAAGFTLIEVIVAMFVIAIGLGALLSALSAAAENIAYMRDKSFAQWVALNRISETRLQRPAAAVGESSGETEFAGTQWQWQQVILEQEVEGILRIDVSVTRTAETGAKSANSTKTKPAMAKAYGFIGTDVGQSTGLDPTWSLPPPRRTGNP